jgi:hypothetical protein
MSSTPSKDKQEILNIKIDDNDKQDDIKQTIISNKITGKSWQQPARAWQTESTQTQQQPTDTDKKDLNTVQFQGITTNDDESFPKLMVDSDTIIGPNKELPEFKLSDKDQANEMATAGFNTLSKS